MDLFSLVIGLTIGLAAWPAVLAVLIFWGSHELRKADREEEHARFIARVQQ